MTGISMEAITYASIMVEGFALMVTLLLLFCNRLTRERRDRKNRLFCAMLLVNAAALLCDLITWIWEGPKYVAIMYPANFLMFSLGYVMTALFTAYLGAFITQRKAVDRYLMGGVYIGSAAAVFLVFLSLFNGMYFYIEDGYWMSGELSWLSITLSLLMILADMVLMFCHRDEFGRRNTIAFLSYGVFPVIAFLIQITGTELTVTWLASTLTMLLIYLMVHVEDARRLDRQKAELAESRLELSRSRIALMISQIQPHFLYNSLTVIDQLIKTDPVLAREAVADFSTYLRCNLSALKRNGLIPFSEELRHVRAYLSLEEMRFGEYLKVEYSVGPESFMLPALTVQPLVENAVRHGLSGKREGGTVRVASRELPDCYEVTVTDDGVGFAPGEKKGDGEHLGLDNIRVRLTEMCNGMLTLHSEIGAGTTASVRIPKRG